MYVERILSGDTAALPVIAWAALVSSSKSVLLLVGRAVYNLYLHPLAHYPGPKWVAAFEFPYLASQFNGVSTREIKAFHDVYGPVVRIAPNTLSFNTAQAWKDIYATKYNGSQVPKDPAFLIDHDQDRVHIISANDADHARIRKSVSHAFSESALKEQEPILQKHCGMLIKQMKRRSLLASTRTVNMREWMNYYSFDTIGDLSFGEDFHALENGEYHHWITDIFTGLMMWRVLRFGEMYSFIGFLLNVMIKLSSWHEDKRDAFFKLPRKMIETRLARKTDRKDFMSYIETHYNQGFIDREEMIKTLCIFITGGSETTGTCLAGLTYYLLANPSKMDILTAEIRGHFLREEEITLESLATVKYLDCCIQETLRIYPPASGIFPRKTHTEIAVDGHIVPPGVALGVHQYATYHSANSFTDPDMFVPERWLPEGERPARYDSDNRAACQPFHLGPRGCIGRNLANFEIRLAISRLIFNFDMKLKDESKNWQDQRVYLIWDKKPLMVDMYPRQVP